ncbi:uncharacterized protein E0L32_002759 [Thyridium curvatum]|uniref:Major facilitator superfamily (MFS) profile domain-containing protein n=1 Tax=Thyridium curvatum TaxID=1093900 RepID=A0A507BNC2_9PEZI|nr:uncharacterized protein E0L32_002759 [Thyridium curvatum]TPX18250.1 hypothetical protein E0L32_002759 [Thyridium curvatum]
MTQGKDSTSGTEVQEEVTGGVEVSNASSEETARYTIFSVHYRWYLTILLGYLCLASSLTANIYFPLINLLAEQYNATTQEINITITVYVVIQGVAPSIFSPLSDTLGRRPVYLLSFALYTAASIGLVFNTTSYAGLLVLRAIQSAGGSATLSLAYAVVADYTVHAERGKFLGPMMAATNLGPNIGPVIGGGAILATGEPRWAFVALVIFGGTSLALIGLSMRETNRTVVGNGCIAPDGLWRAWMDMLSARALKAKSGSNGADRKVNTEDKHQPGATEELRTEHSPSPEGPQTCVPAGRGKLSFPNPFLSLRLLLYKDAFTVLYLAASPYGAWYTITASIPLIYSQEYHFNDLIVGCCYLAGGAGILTGGFVAGKLMDWNYKHTAKKAGIPVDRVRGTDIATFPIEAARSRASYSLLVISAAGFVGYGWTVQKHVHPAASLVLQYFLGMLCTIVHQVYSALLVDIFPNEPGKAGAANNVCRCAVAAALVAISEPVVRAIGRGWFFSIIGLWHGVGSLVAVWILRRWAPSWRATRTASAKS